MAAVGNRNNRDNVAVESVIADLQNSNMSEQSQVLDSIRSAVGPKGVVEEQGDRERYLIEPRGLWHGNSDLIVRPATTEEVSKVVSICHDHSFPIVPLGGNTGLVGGGVAKSGVLLSMERLNRIRELDTANFTLTCEAGCILADIQAAAAEAGRFFPLSLAAEGSCQIGGNLSTNAGGIQVLRYGNARELVLGLEVVLPDGRIWDGLRALRKDNTGYDLKHLFIGAEGTLGIITAAVLKLFPLPRQRQTALLALPSATAAMELFDRCGVAAGDALSAFEIMNGLSFEITVKNIAAVRDPFSSAYPWYVLLEMTTPRETGTLRQTLEGILEEALEDGVVIDGVLAESGTQADDLWRIRESIPEAQFPEGASIKNDVSVPVSKAAEFIDRAIGAAETLIPGIRPVAFGHVGDGNIHFNLSQPVGMDENAFLARWHDVTGLVNDIAADLHGSFSAEHGVGILKRNDLARYRPAVEVEMMAAVKKAIDPANIMNPGKVIPD